MWKVLMAVAVAMMAEPVASRGPGTRVAVVAAFALAAMAAGLAADIRGQLRHG
jgi:hypothetical protein